MNNKLTYQTVTAMVMDYFVGILWNFPLFETGTQLYKETPEILEKKKR